MTGASITCTDLTIHFPVYGADAKSLKKALARAVAVGGALGRHAGVTDVTALANVNLQLKAGDRLGLIGHNGSGKTTLLRALSGAYEPDEGSIEVHGRIASLLDLGRGIDPSATGYENIRLRCRIAGLSTKEIDARMDEIAEFTGLGPFLSMPVKTYSAGMQGRLAFAAATAVELALVTAPCADGTAVEQSGGGWGCMHACTTAASASTRPCSAETARSYAATASLCSRSPVV